MIFVRVIRVSRVPLAGHCVSHSNKECVPVCPLYFGMSHVWTEHMCAQRPPWRGLIVVVTAGL